MVDGRAMPGPKEHPSPLIPTYTGGKDTGSSLVKVECTDATHAVGDESQHIAGEGEVISGGRGGH